MGVDQVARTMARHALSAAIVDVGAEQARQVVIGQGLIGAVLNALNKGVSEDEVAEALHSNGGVTALRMALAASGDAVTEEQRGLLEQLVSRELETDQTLRGPEPTADFGSVALWGPLTAEALCAVLLMAADVADADPDHDVVTALDVLNKDRLRPAGRPVMYEPELRQMARAVFLEIPADERVGVPGGEVAAVNAWLAERARVQRQRGGGVTALAGLFRSAAARISSEDAVRASSGDAS